MLTAAGFLTGLLIGMTGVGGGALMTPLLLLVFGVVPTVAVGTDLLFAAITKSAAGRIHHARALIDWQVVRRLWCGSLPGALLCLLLLRALAPQAMAPAWLASAIGGAVMLMAVGMLLQSRLHGLGTRLRTSQELQFKRAQRPLTVAAGLLLGILVTLTSIGAGALGAVLLSYLYPLRLTPPRLVATDIVHAIPLALFAGIGHLAMGQVDIHLLLMLLSGSIPGVVLGAMLASRLPHRALRTALACVLAVVAGKLIWSVA